MSLEQAYHNGSKERRLNTWRGRGGAVNEPPQRGQEAKQGLDITLTQYTWAFPTHQCHVQSWQVLYKAKLS